MFAFSSHIKYTHLHRKRIADNYDHKSLIIECNNISHSECSTTLEKHATIFLEQHRLLFSESYVCFTEMTFLICILRTRMIRRSSCCSVCCNVTEMPFVNYTNSGCSKLYEQFIAHQFLDRI